MTVVARNKALATQARRIYVEALVNGIVTLGRMINESAAKLLLQSAEYAVMVARRDGIQSWNRHGPAWQAGVISGIRHAAVYGIVDVSKPADGASSAGPLSLVDDDTIEREITASRLALAMMDKASWEFTDLRTRMQILEQQDELAPQDLFRANVVAKLVLDAWTRSGLSNSDWQMLRNDLHLEFAQLLGEAYHEVNAWLLAQSVMPEVDLRPFIRRAAQAAGTAAYPGQSAEAQFRGGVIRANSGLAAAAADAHPAAAAARSPVSSQAEEVLQLLQRIVGGQVPAFAATRLDNPASSISGGGSALAPIPGSGAGAGAGAGATGRGLAPRLTSAIKHAQEALQRAPLQTPGAPEAAAPQILEELQTRNQAFKQVLKQAAETPAERATIELVAMMFQSILMEERIPATVRVWFARLQMPVLRVAVSEPDFFATIDHPARQLIDRMGSCVMGFSAGGGVATTSGAGAGPDPLEREIKRVVQVVEAYPDTGRRVFQTVLTEFEKFLDNYFENENQTTKHGVSLAQQVEQRETLAIQYTIELRKMLSAVPVQDGVREFLFHIWADVLAVTAVRAGAQSEPTRLMKRAAADLIWSASAKVSREERAEVIRRLPPLLKTLRDGMGQAGMAIERQDEQVRTLNNALAAAFTAKSAQIPRERLDELMDQLETLEAMLPEGGDEINIDQSMVRDLSGHESEGMEVVAEGGSEPSPAMLAWAKELQVGGWYMLDYRNRNEAVQLAWRGSRRQMALFVTASGRGVLFQLSRMAGFLQAGLLLPAQDESLTVKATRNALAKLDVDPARLLS
ncbi:DUF1631 domain-containing protein [Roseateles oligotrophus]|uniref:DUF1631 domain-containing protein n=1 Tax=Roseateles oligotrophus TaxID=1769250 RepID=A0ABT2YHI2_9BURK|nr:DUF1631 domain-containing protein [Roseateles oligotrophus]MCV2369514.1 DUF1631 domain-containing protein [Roseateles oligotrophus]